MFSWPFITYFWITLLIVVHVFVTVWVLIGGWFDLMFLLRELVKERVDATDDGRVSLGQMNQSTE
jgi:hypothetical protein